jgi:hypothetical protein
VSLRTTSLPLDVVKNMCFSLRTVDPNVSNHRVFFNRQVFNDQAQTLTKTFFQNLKTRSNKPGPALMTASYIRIICLWRGSISLWELQKCFFKKHLCYLCINGIPQMNHYYYYLFILSFGYIYSVGNPKCSIIHRLH